MNAIALLRKDHDRLRALFKRFEAVRADGAEAKRRLFDEVRLEMESHAHMGREVLFPELHAINADGAALVAEVSRNLQEIDALLLQIEELSAAGADFSDKFESLIECVEEHIALEEGELFQFAEENCPPVLLENLGAEIAQHQQGDEWRRVS